VLRYVLLTHDNTDKAPPARVVSQRDQAAAAFLDRLRKAAKRRLDIVVETVRMSAIFKAATYRAPDNTTDSSVTLLDSRRHFRLALVSEMLQS